VWALVRAPQPVRRFRGPIFVDVLPKERCRPHGRGQVLGDLRLLVEGQAVEVPGPKRRALLALPAKAEGRAVAVDHLVDALWPADPPPGARAALHTHVSRLRNHLGAAAERLQMTAAATGSRSRSGRSTRLGRGGCSPAPADSRRRTPRPRTHCCGRRALWRGPVLADLRDVPPIAAWAIALGELQRETNDLLVRCALDGGHVDEAVETAAEVAAEDPLREPATLLLRSLAAAGRAAEALRVGYACRERLREDAGLDASDELGRLEREIASSHAVRPAAAPILGAGRRRQLLGRQGELAGLRRLVADEQVVTVVGPPGVGKTSVALAIARDHPQPTVVPLAAAGAPADIGPRFSRKPSTCA
jgi:DNA-binding SARP family transcriptional activator